MLFFKNYRQYSRGRKCRLIIPNIRKLENGNRPAILKRAGNRCEKCGVLNGVIGYRDRTGKFHVSDGLQAEADALDGEHIIRIVLTVAHLNHDLTDSSPENLARHYVKNVI